MPNPPRITSKRFRNLALSVAVGLMLLLWLWPEQAPSYRRFQSPPQLRPFTHLMYDFLSSNPFRDGRMWITVLEATNVTHHYYYDIERRRILGELTGARTIFEPQPGAKVLCYNRTAPDRLKERWARFLARVTLGRIKVNPSRNHVETFWLLDLERNSAVRVGETEQPAGAGSSFSPSPDGKFAFNKSLANLTSAEILLFDASVPSIRVVTINGWPMGWWSNREILFKASQNFMVYDVMTGRSNEVLTVEQLGDFFKRNQVDAYPKEVSLFPMWNGREYEFYFTEGQNRWQGMESYLGKLGRPGITPQLVAAEFKFEWSDHFDPSGQWYLFSGRNLGAASSAVFVRHVPDGKQTTLVPDDKAKHFSLPNFYGQDVIYIRSNALWRIGLSGSNAVRVFPPP